MLVLAAVAVILPQLVLSGPEDARFKRLSALGGAQDDAKAIAKQIKCEVCNVAAEKLSEKFAAKKHRDEAAVLVAIGSLCGGEADGGDAEQQSLDFVLEEEGWRVKEEEGIYKMRKVSEEEKAKEKQENLWGGFAVRDAMKQACTLTVAEHQSELAEFLIVRLKKKQQPDAKVISQKLCVELSEACKSKGGKGAKATGSKKEL